MAAPSTPATPHAAAAECQDLNNLRASLRSLSHTSVGTTSAQRVKTEINNINSEVVSLGKTARGRLQGPVDQLKTAVRKLNTAINQLRKNPASSTAENNAVTAFRNVEAKSNSLMAAAKTTCPSSSASASASTGA